MPFLRHAVEISLRAMIKYIEAREIVKRPRLTILQRGRPRDATSLPGESRRLKNLGLWDSSPSP